MFYFPHQQFLLNVHVEVGMMENLKGENKKKQGAIMWKGELFRSFLSWGVRKEETKRLLEPHVCVCTRVCMCAWECARCVLWRVHVHV